MRSLFRTLRLALAALLLAAGDAGAKSYDYWVSGNPGDAPPATTRAGLLLAGGGADVIAAWKWFVACAGGGDIVVLRASGGDGYQSFVSQRVGGVDSIETIKFNDASAARDPRVLKIIAHADGIFLAGGDQEKYISWWQGTPVGDALNAHLRAGKPLGGTSAGLAVLGEYYFAALAGSVTSETALLDPLDQRVTVGRDFIHAPSLAGVITDTHFMARQRLGRLVTFLARTSVDEKPERLAGLGVDEATAMCVEPDGMGKVFTEKSGRAWLVVPTRAPERVKAGEPLVFRHVKVIGIGPESTLNLTKLEVTQPSSTRFVTAADGQIRDEP